MLISWLLETLKICDEQISLEITSSISFRKSDICKKFLLLFTILEVFEFIKLL